MKKFAKGSLITAGILLLLGIVFTVIAVIAAGGRFPSYTLPRDSWAGGIIWSRAEAFEEAMEQLEDSVEDGNWDGWHIYGTGNAGIGKLVVNGKTIGEGRISDQIPVDQIENLQLCLGVGSMELKEKKTDDGKIDISIEGVGTLQYNVSGNVLRVEGFEDLDGLNFNVGTGNVITLEIPKGLSFEEVTTEVGAGVLTIDTLAADKFSANVGAGNLDIGALNAARLDAEIGVGNMTIEDGLCGEADISVSVGSSFYSGTIENYANVDCSLGGAEFRLTGSQELYNYDLECEMGEITVGGITMNDMSEERYVDNGAGADLDLSCEMGTISVSFED